MPLHEDYKCTCNIPSPVMHTCEEHGGQKEETGLCGTCTMIYDERLYEARLRQHEFNFPEDTHTYLMRVSPHYRSLHDSEGKPLAEV